MPQVKLQIVILGVPAYNPRLQTDIIIGLCPQMQLWFDFHLFKMLFVSPVSHRISLDLRSLAILSGAQGFQDLLSYLKCCLTSCA